MTGTASSMAESRQRAAQLRPGASAEVLPPWMTGTAPGGSTASSGAGSRQSAAQLRPGAPSGVLPPWITGTASGGSTASSVAGSGQRAAQLRPGASAGVLPPWMTGTASGGSHGFQHGRKRPECRPASPRCPVGVLPPRMTGTASGRSYGLQHGRKPPERRPASPWCLCRGAAVPDDRHGLRGTHGLQHGRKPHGAAIFQITLTFSTQAPVRHRAGARISGMSWTHPIKPPRDKRHFLRGVMVRRDAYAPAHSRTLCRVSGRLLWRGNVSKLDTPPHRSGPPCPVPGCRCLPLGKISHTRQGPRSFAAALQTFLTRGRGEPLRGCPRTYGRACLHTRAQASRRGRSFPPKNPRKNPPFLASFQPIRWSVTRFACSPG